MSSSLNRSRWAGTINVPAFLLLFVFHCNSFRSPICQTYFRACCCPLGSGQRKPAMPNKTLPFSVDQTVLLLSPGYFILCALCLFPLHTGFSSFSLNPQPFQALFFHASHFQLNWSSLGDDSWPPTPRFHSNPLLQ